jgi:hypothetical protein
MNCFHTGCPNPAAYTFHAGALCIEHASEARQHAPHLVLAPIPGLELEEKTDPNAGESGATQDVGSIYPDKPVTRPGE